MRNKGTGPRYNPKFHNQFEKSEEQITNEKHEKAESWKKEEKEGQSHFRKDEATKKQESK